MNDLADEDARDGFIAMLVHDLKNPLATIAGNADFLAAAPELSADSREAVADIAAGARELNRIAAELIEVARSLRTAVQPRLQEVDAALLLAAIARDAGPRALRAQVMVSLALPAAPPRIRCDAALLRHVLENLLENALRRSPRGGRVTLASDSRPGAAILSVHDPAPPPPAAVRAALFLFGGANNPGGPIGRRLGLIHARLICEAHGGRVSADAPAEGGLRLTIELPD